MLRYAFPAMFFLAPALHAAPGSNVHVGDDVKTLIEKGGNPTSRSAVTSGQSLGGELWLYRSGDVVFTYVVRDGKVRWMSSEKVSRN